MRTHFIHAASCGVLVLLSSASALGQGFGPGSTSLGGTSSLAPGDAPVAAGAQFGAAYTPGAIAGSSGGVGGVTSPGVVGASFATPSSGAAATAPGAGSLYVPTFYPWAVPIISATPQVPSAPLQAPEPTPSTSSGDATAGVSSPGSSMTMTTTTTAGRATGSAAGTPGTATTNTVGSVTSPAALPEATLTPATSAASATMGAQAASAAEESDTRGRGTDSRSDTRNASRGGAASTDRTTDDAATTRAQPAPATSDDINTSPTATTGPSVTTPR